MGECNNMIIYICLVWAYCSITISWQQQGSDPVRIPGITTHQGCPSQDHINAQRVKIRRLIGERFISSASSCGGEGWRRVAFLNMCDPNESCPSNWTLTTSPVRGCGRSSSSRRTCDSVVYPVRGQNYSSVCGRILAYHLGISLGFAAILVDGKNTTEDAYVSGVSVTHGPAGARQHIWTFVGALTEEVKNPLNTRYNCPCTNNYTMWAYQLPNFIGSNYFCDTGNRGPRWNDHTLYLNDPLWDGEGCDSNSTCCEFNSPPWFKTSLPAPTRQDLEIRLCSYLEEYRENKIISLLEVYIK